jgi:hypothetical protein
MEQADEYEEKAGAIEKEAKSRSSDKSREATGPKDRDTSIPDCLPALAPLRLLPHLTLSWIPAPV